MAAHFLSNPARRPTSLATASISITLLGLRSEQPAEGRDPVCRGASQVPSARPHSDPPRDPDSVLWSRVLSFSVCETEHSTLVALHAFILPFRKLFQVSSLIWVSD